MAAGEELELVRDRGGGYVGLLSEIAFEALNRIMSQENVDVAIILQRNILQRVLVRGERRVQAHPGDVH